MLVYNIFLDIIYFMTDSQPYNQKETEMLMDKNNSLLLIIDVQEHLAPVMDSPRQVISNCSKLISVAKKMNVPFIITEQYPKGLGPTMFDLRQAAGEDAKYFSKLHFSCAKEPEIMKAVEESGKKQIIIAGAETHICITQTAIELKHLGYEVFVVSNASSSRDAVQNVLGLQRMSKNGIDIVTTEMVLFEWLEQAGTDEFKEISKKYIV